MVEENPRRTNQIKKSGKHLRCSVLETYVEVRKKKFLEFHLIQAKNAYSSSFLGFANPPQHSSWFNLRGGMETFGRWV